MIIIQNQVLKIWKLFKSQISLMALFDGSDRYVTVSAGREVQVPPQSTHTAAGPTPDQVPVLSPYPDLKTSEWAPPLKVMLNSEKFLPQNIDAFFSIDGPFTSK